MYGERPASARWICTTYSAGAPAAFSSYRVTLSKIEKVLADSAYRGDKFATAAQHVLGRPVETAKRNELHRFAVIPKRWVVECSFAWLEKLRT